MSTPPDQARDAEKRHTTQMTDAPVRSGSDLEKSGSPPSVLQPSSSDDNRSRVAQDKDTGPDPDAGDGPDVNADAVTIVGQALSRATSRSSITPAPPPDGGVTAWMASKVAATRADEPASLTFWTIVFSAHLVIMNTW